MPMAAKALKRPETAFPVLPKDALQRLLRSVERPFVDPEARARLQVLLERRGEQHVLLLLRTIIESEGNGNALVEPIVSAVSSVIVDRPQWTDKGLAWIEAFDTLDLNGLVATMRGLDLFKETSLAKYLSWSIDNKLRKIFELPVPLAFSKPGPKTGRKHSRNTPRYTKSPAGGPPTSGPQREAGGAQGSTTRCAGESSLNATWQKYEQAAQPRAMAG
jgi:hypothetical protein